MTQHSYHMIFELHGAFYALNVEYIHEIIALPKLMDPSELPFYVAGLFNYHGDLIWVIDLAKCLGNSSFVHAYEAKKGVQDGGNLTVTNGVSSLDEYLVVLKFSHHVLGVVIPKILDMINLSSSSFLNLVGKDDQKQFPSMCSHVVDLPIFSAISNSNEAFASILDPHLLFKFLERNKEEDLPFITDDSLLNPINHEIKSSSIATAVVKIEGEYFGIDAQIVKEFINIEYYTPIPHAPSYLMGCLNFKGHVLTLLDIWPILTKGKAKKSPSSQVLVMHYNRVLVGVLVDEVVDMLDVSPIDLPTIPLEVEETPFGHFMKHIVSYEKKFLFLLDITKVFDSIIEI